MKKLRILCIILVVCFLVMLPVGCKTASETTAAAAASGETTAVTTAAAETTAVVKSGPVSVQVLDVAGEEPMAKASILQFAKDNPDLITYLDYFPASAPEVATKIQAEQKGGSLTTILVFAGFEGMEAGVKQGVYEELIPKYQDQLSGVMDSLTEEGKIGFDAAAGFGIPHVCSPGGPMFTYNPDKIKPEDVPTTPQELLDWAKANPGKFTYPRPSNSGAGYEWLQGIPYLLGEAEPAGDPANWTLVWPYLQELGKYIDYYPTGSAIAYKELAEGTRYILAVHVGYETNTRVLGTLPLNFKQTWFKNSVWVLDTNFMCIPKGLDEARTNIALKLMAYLDSPEQQIYTFDGGFMYPGPAIKGVTLDMAPQESRDALQAVITPEVLDAIATIPKVAPLPVDYLIKAFDMWDKQVGSQSK
jgi:putative spermidine/putrescine transport system substrate-binding protein